MDFLGQGWYIWIFNTRYGHLWNDARSYLSVHGLHRCLDQLSGAALCSWLSTVASTLHVPVVFFRSHTETKCLHGEFLVIYYWSRKTCSTLAVWGQTIPCWKCCRGGVLLQVRATRLGITVHAHFHQVKIRSQIASCVMDIQRSNNSSDTHISI